MRQVTESESFSIEYKNLPSIQTIPIVNAMTDDGLATERAKALTSMVLSYFVLHIPLLAL